MRRMSNIQYHLLRRIVKDCVVRGTGSQAHWLIAFFFPVIHQIKYDYDLHCVYSVYVHM